MTLREAADRTSRSITTLRRYIRNGKLDAELRDGRYGPEYFVSEDGLVAAGLHSPVTDDENADADTPPETRALARLVQDSVPMRLYQELQMKHEQLLVQYGMVRSGGLRAMDLQARLDDSQRQLDAARAELVDLRQRLAREGAELERRLRETELELEGKRLENAALAAKVRGLEMLTRNAVTNETIDRRFDALMDQARRVNRLAATGTRPAERTDPTDH